MLRGSCGIVFLLVAIICDANGQSEHLRRQLLTGSVGVVQHPRFPYISYSIQKSVHQPATIVAIGDSIMLRQAKLLTSKAEAVYVKSYHYDEVNFKSIFRLAYKIKRKIDVIYINFGWFHMMHMHPIRAEWETPNMILLYHLESMLDAELASYATVARRVVVQIPSPICDTSYNASYRDWMNNQTVVRPLCARHVQAHAEEVMLSTQWPSNNRREYTLDLREYDDARTFCEYALTSAGAEALMHRVRKYCASRNITCFDYPAVISNIPCSLESCKDGRHFNQDTVVQPLIHSAFLSFLGWKQNGINYV